MAITEKNLHTKIKTVEKSGSDQVIKILYPTNYDSDVLLTDHKNTNIPSSAVTVKDVIDSVGSLAFKSSIDDATTSSSGLMSATDKQKINMIDLSTGAVGTITSVQVNGTSIASKGVANIPLANGTKTAGAILTTSAVTSATGYTASPVINGVPYYKDTITTYDDATQSKHGLMTAAMKKKLDGIEEGANKYVLKPASTTLGGVKTTSTVSSATGYTASPIIDGVVYYQNTTYNDLKGATASAPGTHGLVPAPAAGKQTQFLRGDGTWATPTDTKYDDATQSVHGLMSAADKRKLDGLVPTYVGSETPSYSCLWFDTTEA